MNTVPTCLLLLCLSSHDPHLSPVLMAHSLKSTALLDDLVCFCVSQDDGNGWYAEPRPRDATHDAWHASR